ncbi:GUN4 domain-containing protein [Stenomitos frigidus]|uniref:NTPase (NACHT family) n=1 Tax=Stenomitos frigidus ULC18 TaxID=2107698 RepID=A0A2T1DTJ1_9CYAN|nr:GUN4 domain-containing protein [Stenomitos frigidus]PSB23792.1 NTPase (NACHT family) [Stenomitos frigidus ULC18]
MSEESSAYSPTTIEKVFELLDNKLVTFGIPGALSFVGVTKARESHWTEASLFFAGAAGVWITIKIGKKLSPKLDQAMDGAIASIERSFSDLRSDFEGQYLKQQAMLCEEFTTEGFNPDRTTLPLLAEVFVPLELSGALGIADLAEPIAKKSPSRQRNRWQRDAVLRSDNLSIWDLLARSQRDRKFRQMSIQAKGGMGKTTLLRHITLIYGLRQYRRYRAPKLVPVLLRLRDHTELLIQAQPPGLPTLITEHHVPSLAKNQPLTPPPQWAEKLLASGAALVMFDGFDEVPDGKRQAVSHWISAQMQEYSKAVFIVTSRPAGYKDYVAQRPAVPIFVNTFNPTQQETFIRRWYRCQEESFRSKKQLRHARRVAEERADQLIAQLQQRRAELGYMAENPLLLNMLVTFHRFDPARELPRQRLDLYRGIVKLQLDDRPRARFITMVLPFERSLEVLQTLALEMVKANRIKVPHQSLLKFLGQQPVFQREEITPAEWLKQIVEVSELLVEREPGEYEFPHLSFQGFFAATRLAQPQDMPSIKANAQLILQHWNGAVWREAVLLYTAQLNPKLLDQVIRKACELGSEAAELSILCLKEYPRPEKLSAELVASLQTLKVVAQDSKYQKLEDLLKAQQWRDADQETYRLMITTAGKDEGQWFDRADLENFPCEDLKTLDRLWTHYSKTPDYPNGKWGFSIQKQIWQECGSPMDYNDEWKKFGDRVGWRKGGNWIVSYDNLTLDLDKSLKGEFPWGVWFSWLGVGGFGFWSSLLSRRDL